MKKLILFVCLIASVALSGETTNIAVLDLSGTGVSEENLNALTNRLRLELFETEKYTVIERSMMEEILKEQGFQQTGCTDASCAVEAGQLLNVHRMVVGSIDRVGRVYTINIRELSVKTGEIENNVNVDCADCGPEDLMLKGIRRAARQLAGLEADDPIAVATDVRGRASFKYKGYKGEEAGTMSISVKPSDAQVFVDDSAYGEGNMIVDYVPVGTHRIAAARDSFHSKSTDAEVTFNENTKVELVLRKDRDVDFYFSLGYAMLITAIEFSDSLRFYRDTLGARQNTYDSFSYHKPVVGAGVLEIGIKGGKNRWGLMGYALPPIRTRKFSKAEPGGNEFRYTEQTTLGGGALTYSRTLFSIRKYIEVQLGLCGGFYIMDINVSPDYAMYGGYSYQGDIGDFEYQQSDVESAFVGAPHLSVQGGLRRISGKITYRLFMGEGHGSGYTGPDFKVWNSLEAAVAVTL